MDISIATICSQEFAMFEAWLKHWCDVKQIKEIVVIDTSEFKQLNDSFGLNVKTNEFKEKLKELTKKYRKLLVYDLNWNNSFCAARNFSLSMLKAKTEWVLFCDIDEFAVVSAQRLINQCEETNKAFSPDIIHIPHVRFKDFEELWFLKNDFPKIEITINTQRDLFFKAYPSPIKNTMTLYKRNFVFRWSGLIHEKLIEKENAKRILCGTQEFKDVHGGMFHYSKVNLDKMPLMGHYDCLNRKLKAKYLNESEGFVEGIKRAKYRLISSVVYDNEVFNKSKVEDAMLNKNKKYIEYLGEKQIKETNKEHIILKKSIYNAYGLNSKEIKDLGNVRSN